VLEQRGVTLFDALRAFYQEHQYCGEPADRLDEGSGLDAAGDYEWRAATSWDGSVRPGTVSAAPDTGEPTTIMEESSA